MAGSGQAGEGQSSAAAGKRVVVTGAAGFIGRQLVAHLAHARHVAIAVVRPGTHPPAGSQVCFARVISAQTGWEDVLAGADAVVHLADGLRILEGHRGRGRGAAFGAQTQAELVARSVHLAEAAARAGVRTFIYMSSIKALAGEHAAHPITATTPPMRERSLYGRMKYRLEGALAEICEAHSLRLICLRPPLVYGHGAGGNFARLLALADSPWPLPFASFQAPRSLIARRNLCDAIMAVLENTSVRSGSYLLHDGPPLSVCELVTLIRASRGRPRRLYPLPGAGLLTRLPGIGPVLERLSKPLMLEDEDFRRDFSWSPPLTTAQAIEELLSAGSAE